MLPGKTFYILAVDGFPSWDKPDNADTFSVNLKFVHEHVGDKRIVKSHQIASEWDDLSVGSFYYRDISNDGLPYLDEGETYHSQFWFQLRSDFDAFKEKYAEHIG